MRLNASGERLLLALLRYVERHGPSAAARYSAELLRAAAGDETQLPKGPPRERRELETALADVQRNAGSIPK